MNFKHLFCAELVVAHKDEMPDPGVGFDSNSDEQSGSHVYFSTESYEGLDMAPDQHAGVMNALLAALGLSEHDLNADYYIVKVVVEYMGRVYVDVDSTAHG